MSSGSYVTNLIRDEDHAVDRDSTNKDISGVDDRR